MNGIFAYTGTNACSDVVISGIEMLRKRAGDTTGIAFKKGNEISCVKTRGGADVLRSKLKPTGEECSLALAVCADAYRTKPTSITAPPAANNLFAVAADGVVENFDYLKCKNKMPFPIATDEDLLLALLCIYNEQDKASLLVRLTQLVFGNPSIVFFSNEENALYCYSGNGPLVVGMSQNGFFVSSEVNALIPIAEKYFVLEEAEYAKITSDRAVVFDSRLKRIKKTPVSMPDSSYFENNYILSDEIYYCPLAIRETYNRFVKDSGLAFDYLKLGRHNVDKISRIILTGSGSSYNVAKISAYNLEMLTDIPVFAYPSGELRYSGAIMNKNTLLIAISHRGETENTIACVKRARGFGAQTIGVGSNTNSALSRACNAFIDVGCDFDYSDISLRSFISDYLAVCFLTLHLGNKNGVVTELYLNVTLKMAHTLAGKVSSSIKATPQLQLAAEKMSNSQNVLLCGLGADYPLSLEAAQKLRRISGVNAYAYELCDIFDSMGEIMSRSLVVAIISNNDLAEKALYYLRRAKASGVEVIIVTTADIEAQINDFENVIAFNDSIPIFNSISCLTGIYKIAVMIDEMNNESLIENAG